MFTGSTKLPPTKTPQPERLDEVYAALRRGLQNALLLWLITKRSASPLQVEELYDAYCIQRRLRDGASKMVAAFNSATGSREARESLSEANKGYKECTEHMCSLESEFESQMGEFHVKMKGLAGFARLCAGDQYEVIMRYGRQRWRLRGRVEVSNKQIWDSEEYIFLPLVTELLSIKVTELKSLANHVVVGSVSCEMLDLFCPLPQTLAVDINDLGTVKLNLEVTWRCRTLRPNPPCSTQPAYVPRSKASFSFSARLIKMTRSPPAAQSPNGCCPIRALPTHPPCGSRCFM
uniref:Rho family-interacting cell polarization regulator 1-like n=1 Tax=Takifugu rubripes TaxID=31033 RepID=A0A674MIZ4_TAKRU